MIQTSALATQSVTLAWTPSTDPNVVGYNIYYGVASRTYTNKVDVGNVTNATISGLIEGTTYYFAATAYNVLGIESDYSSEVSYTVPFIVNQPPTLNTPGNVTINEDATQQTVNLSGIGPGAASEVQTLSVSATSGNPTLIPNPTVNYTSPNTTGTLNFTPVANANGSAVITVTVNDGGLSNNITSRTFTVTVNPVNDPPTFDAVSNLTINEDPGLVTVNLTGIAAGPGNESQTLVVTASSSNTGLIPAPSVSYTSPNSTGSISFTPVANANGTATLTVTVNDGQSANNVFSRTFTVTVSPVNDPPTLNAISDLVVNEGASQQTVNLSGIGSGAANESQTLAVSATSDNPALIPNPAVTYSSPNATGSLRFTPATNANGSATITVTVNDGQAANNLFSRTFTVTVAPVNNQPTLEAIGNVTISEDAAQQTVNLSGISSGAANENQTLTVAASSSNTGLIPAPTVSYASPDTTGSLTFTPVANANGTATITVTVNDGQLANNLFSRTFTVTVSPVNDPPTLDPIPNLALNESAGLQIVDLSGISSGAANENQTLSITAASSNPGLVPTPTVTYSSPGTTGTLRFTPVAGGHGSSVITVTVNDGQASGNLVTRTFTVTINGMPTITSIPNQIISTNSSTGPLAFTVSDPETPAGSLSLSAASSAPALVPVGNITFGGSGANRTVTVTPAANQSGVADITIMVSDGIASSNTTFQVTVLNQPTPPTGLTILVSGNGYISPAPDPQTMTVGQLYTLTAVPAEGQEFAGWSGSFRWSSPKITFYATSNLLLQANFVPTPYVPTSGSYSGLLYEDAEVRIPSSGFFTMAVTTKGNYTAKLQVGKSKYSFKGKLGLQCMATNVIALKTGGFVVLRLRVGTNAESGQIFGQVSDYRWVASLRGDRAGFDAKTNPAPFAGTYTVWIPGQENDPTLPAGHSYGTAVVDAGGRVKFAGSLADGTKVTQSSTLSRNGLWPFYASLYSGQGLALSWISFADRANDDLNGEIIWLKAPTIKSKYYPGGFASQTEAVGSRYVAPLVGNIMNLSTALMEFTGGNLASGFTNSFTLGPGNQLIASDGSGFALSFTTAKGLFKGKVNHPGTGQPLSYAGVVLPKMHAGYGYFLGTNQSSQVVLQP